MRNLGRLFFSALLMFTACANGPAPSHQIDLNDKELGLLNDPISNYSFVRNADNQSLNAESPIVVPVDGETIPPEEAIELTALAQWEMISCPEKLDTRSLPSPRNESLIYGIWGYPSPVVSTVLQYHSVLNGYVLTCKSGVTITSADGGHSFNAALDIVFQSDACHLVEGLHAMVCWTGQDPR